LNELEEYKSQLQELSLTLDNDEIPLQYDDTTIDKTVLLGIAKEVRTEK